MAIDFPNINPVLISIGLLNIRWYSLAYIFGILIAWLLFIKVNRFSLKKEVLDSMLSYVIFGVIVGARLGEVFFYLPIRYLQDPISIFKIWEGGMSFHGGAIGVIVALIIFCNRNNVPVMQTLDLTACFAPIGLFLGRLANFINGELWGKVTDVPWGVVFPYAGPLPRHPSQIYEALSEGLFLFCIMIFLLFKTRARDYPGLMSGIMFILYAIARIIMEFYREPDAQFNLVFANHSLPITLGQALSAPMLIIGIFFAVYASFGWKSKSS